MHTSRYDIPGYGEVTVIYNSGFDGEARILWGRGEERGEARIPAGLLVQVAGNVALDHVRNETVAFLENLGPRLGVQGLVPDPPDEPG